MSSVTSTGQGLPNHSSTAAKAAHGTATSSDIQERNSQILSRNTTKPPEELSNPTSISPSAALSPEQLTELAKYRIQKIISAVLQHFQIEPTAVNAPVVTASDKRGTSAHDSKNNEIVIHPDHIDSITTYGEEIFHWLRAQLKPYQERKYVGRDLPHLEQKAVDEMFGFLGRAIVNDLCKGTEFDSLCDHDKKTISQSTINGHMEETQLVTMVLDGSVNEVSSDILLLQKKLTHLSQATDAGIIELHCISLGLHLNTCSDNIAKVPETHPHLKSMNRLIGMACAFCSRLKETLGDTNRSDGDPSSDSHVNRKEELELLLRVAHVLAHKDCASYLKASGQSLKVFKDHKDDLADHVAGYSCGLRLLTQAGNKLQPLVASMLVQSSKDLYLEHIFQPPQIKGFGNTINGILNHIRARFALNQEKRRLSADKKAEEYQLILSIPLDHTGEDDRRVLRDLLGQSK